MTTEGLWALLYTGGGVLAVRAFDSLLRWRASSRVSPDTELQATLEAAAEIREERRKQVEELRTERNETATRADKAETSLAAMRERAERAEDERDELRAAMGLRKRRRREEDRDQ